MFFCAECPGFEDFAAFFEYAIRTARGGSLPVRAHFVVRPGGGLPAGVDIYRARLLPGASCSFFSDSKKMDVLLISVVRPDRRGVGIQKRAAEHLDAIATAHDVDLLVFEKASPHQMKVGEELAQKCRTVHIVPYAPQTAPKAAEGSLALLWNGIRGSAESHELPEPELVREAFAALPRRVYDVLFCFRLRSALIVQLAGAFIGFELRRRVVDFDDIESQVLERENRLFRRGQGKVIGAVRSLRVIHRKLAERDAMRSFDDVIVCSEKDGELLRRKRPRARIHVVPNSIALKPLHDAAGEVSEPSILFVGTMRYPPNRDGILWFCREVFPLIRDAVAGVKLSVVGFDPPSELQAIADRQIDICGGVDSVEPYYEQASIAVVPIRYGGGTRIKILEAMAYACPIVTTTIGAEGIAVEDSETAMVADDEVAFAKSCVRLLQDDTLHGKLARNGYRLVETTYSSAVVAESLRRILAPDGQRGRI